MSRLDRDNHQDDPMVAGSSTAWMEPSSTDLMDDHEVNHEEETLIEPQTVEGGEDEEEADMTYNEDVSAEDSTGMALFINGAARAQMEEGTSNYEPKASDEFVEFYSRINTTVYAEGNNPLESTSAINGGSRDLRSFHEYRCIIPDCTQTSLSL
ncbi:uncharacterized protein MELLADRAFT_67944 [Melampsora larici-populina 98AG31]|uniref:Uncharacterized protein n=1 Tax=Melampsora larici-populina (strain 98AG31 / pathotype 3-4-7) TaxID=747676 RepID=F4S506_MELLP|nr:uncharacterized protein MELLADRAFT_67944 [Melampsora larici-populina 98AG31]EGG00287.1 hypothetical protein MELLADRAFT_67944 [Melampsora larici-populina 98AG31]